MGADTYNTIVHSSEGIYRDKGSKFIALAFPVTTVEEIKEIIDSLRKEYHDARHHCYAYMLGPEKDRWRVNDDGEPSGTAGKPILGQISSHDLTDILIVVIRYFGGTLLGVSGLINAYRSAAADALSKTEIVNRQVMVAAKIDFPYQAINEVMKLVKEYRMSVVSQTIDSECSITVGFPRSIEEAAIGRFGKIPGVRLQSLSQAEG